MKNLLFSLILTIHLTPVYSQLITQGTITYSVTKPVSYWEKIADKLPQEKLENKNYVDNTIQQRSQESIHTIYFKDDKVRHFYTSVIVNDRIGFYDSVTYMYYKEIDSVGKILISNSNQWKKVIFSKWKINDQKVTIQYIDTEIKEIASYQCKKAIVYWDDNLENPTIVYYSEEIPNVNIYSTIPSLKGFPMYMEFHSGVIYTVTNVDTSPLPAKKLQLPKAYSIK